MASYSDPRTQSATGESAIRVGRVTDNSQTGGVASAGTPTGVPLGAVPVLVALSAPLTADVDYFIASTATGTTAKSNYTFLNNNMPNVATGPDGLSTYSFARNVSATLSGAATATAVLTGFDAQGVSQTETLTWTAESGAKYSSKTFSRLTGVATTSDTNRNLTVGFANEFGLPYPCYSLTGFECVKYDADSADYANTPMTAGGVEPGVPVQVAETINLADLRVWNDFATNLPGTAATDDLGLVTLASTVGTDWDVAVQTDDLDNAGTNVPFYAASIITLPQGYVSGGALSVVINCGMIGSVAGTACTIDVQAFLLRAPAADLCTTAAQDMNSLTAANKTFTFTPTGLVAGDQLLVRYTILATDTAATAPSFARINKISLSCLQNSDVSGATSPLYTFTAGDPTSTTADRYGKVLIGSDNTPTGTLSPNGTASYAIFYLCTDAYGVANSGNTGFIYDQD